MQKSAPSATRILIAVVFALSCFGLLLFLWVSFGGPVPLKPQSYRVTAYFPEAISLAQESDVRIGGVSVGKVKSLELAAPSKRIDGQDVTAAEIEIEPKFAPLNTDSRALLRQKTLLGETYVELTSGTNPKDSGAPISLGAAANNSDAELEGVEPIPEGGELPIGQTRDQVLIDEIFNALDEETRASFQRWQQGAAVAIQNRGLDLNDSLGNLGPFLTDASDVVGILKRQKQSLKGLVRDTGEVFDALTEREQALAGVITNSNDTFGALASEDAALEQVFQVLPTFQRETRATLDRLDRFQSNTLPLIKDLQPVADDATPTLRSVRELAPDLESLVTGDLDALNRSSRKGLPALQEVVDGLAPLLEATDPFLANLNPVIDYLDYHKTTVTDFLTAPPAGLSGTLAPEENQPGAQFSLRQVSYITPETLSFYGERLPTNRGNGYLRPLDLVGSQNRVGAQQIFPSFDCANTGDGVRTFGDGGDPEVGVDFGACILSKDYPDRFGGGKFPTVVPDDNP